MENKITYYKGFDGDLKCRDFQFTEGEVFEIDGEPNLCNRGFHFCTSLKEVYSFYGRGQKAWSGAKRSEKVNKFAIVEPLGKLLVGTDKCCTNKLKIIKVLSEEELDAIDKQDKENYIKKNVFCLDVVYELQQKYNFIIGGSVSLFLMGYTLERNEGSIDLDIIMPYFQKIRSVDFSDGVIREIEEFDAKPSGNDFSSTFAVTTSDGRFLKADVKISPEQVYDVVTYEGRQYKVCELMSTLEAKCRYATGGNVKHKNDILHLLGTKKKENKSSMDDLGF